MGYVSIEDKIVTLYSNSYTKRIKIRDSFSKWIDTKPIFTNEIDKSLILYFKKLLSFILIHPIFRTEIIDESFILIYNTPYPINFIDKSFILINTNFLFTNEIDKYLILYYRILSLVFYDRKLSLILYFTRYN